MAYGFNDDKSKYEGGRVFYYDGSRSHNETYNDVFAEIMNTINFENDADYLLSIEGVMLNYKGLDSYGMGLFSGSTVSVGGYGGQDDIYDETIRTYLISMSATGSSYYTVTELQCRFNTYEGTTDPYSGRAVDHANNPASKKVALYKL